MKSLRPSGTARSGIASVSLPSSVVDADMPRRSPPHSELCGRRRRPRDSSPTPAPQIPFPPSPSSTSRTHKTNLNQNQNQKNKRLKTLDGGSLGSSVDEERGQPRELMRIAGLSEHRHLERTLRLRDPLSRGPVRSRGGKLHVSSYCEKHLTVPARQPSKHHRAVETGTSQGVSFSFVSRLADRGVAPFVTACRAKRRWLSYLLVRSA